MNRKHGLTIEGMTQEIIQNTPTTEERILEAAENEFLRKGFAAARTTSIAEAAGVNHAMLHYYFRTKEKMFERVIGNKMELIRDMILGSIDAPDISLFEKIETAVSRHLDFIASNPDLPRFFINEICANPDRMVQLSDFIINSAGKVTASLQQQIDEEAAAGRCRKVDARMLLMDILSLNAFPFVAAPLVNLVCGDVMADRENFLFQRKKETLDLIMRKLAP